MTPPVQKVRGRKQRPKTFFEKLGIQALSFIFPPLCFNCASPTPDSEFELCQECIEKLNRNIHNRKACPICGINLDYHRCACLLSNDQTAHSVYSLFDFDDTVKTLMHEIKYQGKSNFAASLMAFFAHQIPFTVYADCDYITPVPLHYRKLLRRGYNQSYFLALGILQGIDIPEIPILPGLLKRTRFTKTQTKLNKEQRRQNLYKAFAIPPAYQKDIEGKTIIVVDDVVTTGATTEACARVLLDGGAAKVKVLSLARD